MKLDAKLDVKLPALLALCALSACSPAAVPRGDGATQLAVDAEGSLQNPCFSPDGDRVVLTRWRGGYNTAPADLLVHDLANGGTRALVADGSANVNLPGACWHDDAIVFSSDRGAHDEIWAVDADGEPGDERALTAREGFAAYEPTFSPDGARIAFESHVVDVEGFGVVATARVGASPAGEGEVALVTSTEADSRQPSWSPAGGAILFQRLDGEQWDLWLIDDDGANERRITGADGSETDASFSPDGERVVYSGERDDVALANLFVVDAEGGEPERATSAPSYDGAASFSPDGARIAFESVDGEPDGSAGTTLWIIDAP